MDLANPANWNQVARFTKRVAYTYSDRFITRYVALQPSEFSVASPIISVEASTENRKPTWFLACWASFHISLMGGQRHEIAAKKCWLDTRTLLNFPFYDAPLPYIFRLNFPYWLESISVDIKEYIDQSGRYFASQSEQKLADMIEGQELTLTNVDYAFDTTDPNLIVSTFSEITKYERYEVGRFKSLSTGEVLAEPVIEARPYLLVVHFTSRVQIFPGTVTVKVVES